MAKSKTTTTRSKSAKGTTPGVIENDNGKKRKSVQNRRSARKTVPSTKAVEAAVEAYTANNLQTPISKTKGGENRKGSAKSQNQTVERGNLARISDEIKNDIPAKRFRSSPSLSKSGDLGLDGSKTMARSQREGASSSPETFTGGRSRGSGQGEEAVITAMDQQNTAIEKKPMDEQDGWRAR